MLQLFFSSVQYSEVLKCHILLYNNYFTKDQKCFCLFPTIIIFYISSSFSGYPKFLKCLYFLPHNYNYKLFSHIKPQMYYCVTCILVLFVIQKFVVSLKGVKTERKERGGKCCVSKESMTNTNLENLRQVNNTLRRKKKKNNKACNIDSVSMENITFFYLKCAQNRPFTEI